MVTEQLSLPQLGLGMNFVLLQAEIKRMRKSCRENFHRVDTATWRQMGVGQNTTTRNWTTGFSPWQPIYPGNPFWGCPIFDP